MLVNGVCGALELLPIDELPALSCVASVDVVDG